jgi:hypothetical protein
MTPDENTSAINARFVQKESQEKAAVDKYMATFPDPNADIIVARLLSPIPAKESTEHLTTGETCTSPCTFDFYEEMKNIEATTSPTKFRYIRGNLFASGGVQCKHGYIICTRDILDKIKSRIERVPIAGSLHFTIIPITLTQQEVITMITQITKELKP